MADHSDEKLRNTAKKMRDVFFAEFGHPDGMSEAELNDTLASLIAIHAGEVVEFAARFCPGPVRDNCIVLIDKMIETNAEAVGKLLGKGGQADFVRGDFT